MDELEMLDLITSGSEKKATVIKREGTNEVTTDSPELASIGGIKYDAGKPCAFRGLISYFPRACELVASVSSFGAAKYDWGGWNHVPDGVARYSDAMVRHLIKEGKGEFLDPDSSLPHAAHTAWGALARLELIMREQEKNDETNQVSDTAG